jgi:hypothetical protein
MRTPSMYLKDAFWYLSLQSREPRTEVSICLANNLPYLGLTRRIYLALST